MQTYPIKQLQTRAAKQEVRFYRTQGVKDSDMSFFRNESGEEIVLIKKRGIIDLAKRSPMDPMQQISNLHNLGVPLELDDELELISAKKSI